MLIPHGSLRPRAKSWNSWNRFTKTSSGEPAKVQVVHAGLECSVILSHCPNMDVVSFGPTLVDGGAAVSGIDQLEIDTNFGNHSIQGQQPRTAVGWVEKNHLKLVVVDGRSEGYSRGVTMTELAQIMAGLGVRLRLQHRRRG